MTFLNPIVLLGLLAASIPIIIHLLNLKKLKIIEFSSIQFLREMQKNKMRKLKLKQLILLILRTLIIIFLVISFSRPTIQSANITGLGSRVKNTILIFLDNTPSMDRQDVKGELFNQAKKISNKILDTSEENDEIYLIPFSEINILENEYEPISKSLAPKKLEGITISDQHVNFSQVLIAASKIIESTKNLSKEIFIVTDFQKGNISGTKTLLDKSFDANTRLYVFTVGEKEDYNISIDSLFIQSRIFEINKTVNISVYLSNHSNTPAMDVNANMFFNDKNVSSKGIDLEIKSTGQFDFSGTIQEYDFVSGTIKIEDDNFLRDNKRYFNFYVPKKIRVLMAQDSPSDLTFINLVFSQTIDENSEPIFSITTTNTQFLNSFNLENFDLIVIASPEKINDLAKLKSYLENGGKVIILPGINSNPIGFNRITSQLSFPEMMGVTGTIIKNTLTQATAYTRFKAIDFQNPILKGIFSEQKIPQFEPPKVFYSFNYKPGENGNEIIELENNFSFLIEKKIGNGIVYLFTSALSLNWNEFPIKPIFVPIINRLGLYSSTTENHSFIAEEEIIIKLKKPIKNNLTLLSPDGKETLINEKEMPNPLTVNLGKLSKAGNYILKSDGEQLALISINLNSIESVLEKIEEEDFEKFIKDISPNLKFKIFKNNTDPIGVIKQERFGTELWKLFLFLAILCAIIEMIIARTTREDLKNLNIK